VLVYRGSLTQTFRPGIKREPDLHAGQQQINGGVWYESARHRQTQPAVRVDQRRQRD